MMESQQAGAIDGSDLERRNAPAVIIVVDNRQSAGEFIPALARVGALPVLLRAILSAQMLQPSRLVVSIASTAAGLREELCRLRRLPQSLEWHDRRSGADLVALVRQVATTADRILLLSGSNIYKPALLCAASDGDKAADAVVFKTGGENAGVCCVPTTAVLNQHGAIDSADDLQSWIEAKCNVTIRPVPGEEWQGLVTPEDRLAAEHKLDQWMVKPTDGVYARFNRRISIPISRQLIRTPITPNAVTLLILAVSVVAGLFFARGGYWNIVVGALLSVWASILDGCDGEVARFTLQSSKVGCWLDTVCDYLYYLITFTGITWGLNRRSSTNVYLVWGSVLGAGMLLSFFVVSRLRRRMAAEQPDKFLALFQKKVETRSSNPLLFLARHTEFVIRRCFFPYALLVAALLNVIKEVFVVTAISANLVWIIVLYSSFALSRNDNSSGRIQTRMEPGASFSAQS